MTNYQKNTLYFDLLFLTLSIGACFLLFLGSMPLHMPDEARYSQVAHEMLLSGDFVLPTINGVGFLDKPPFVYYLQALAMKLGGVNAFTARLPAAFLALSSCLMLYLCGRKLINRRVGLLAAYILASMPLFFIASHYANMDMPVCALLTNALCCFLLAQHTPSYTKKLMMTGYVFTALALLTKGLIALAFPVAIVTFWSILNRQRPKLHLLPGLSLFFLITTPWFFLIGQRVDGFYYYFFIIQHFYRYLGESFNNQQPFWFYLPIVLAGSLPWILFPLTQLRQWSKPQSSVLIFILVWFFFILSFFSFPSSKPLGYIFPTFPPLAILIAYAIDSCPEQSLRCGRFLGVLSMVLGLLFLLLPFFRVTTPLTPFYFPLAALGSFLLLGGQLSLRFIKARQLNAMLALLIGSLFLINICGLKISQRLIDNSNLPLVNYLKKNLKSGDKLAMIGRYNFDVLFYLEHRPVYVADYWLKGLYKKDALVHQLALGMQHHAPKHYITPKRLQQLWQDKNHRLFVISNGDYYAQFKGGVLLKQLDDNYLLSNQ